MKYLFLLFLLALLFFFYPIQYHSGPSSDHFDGVRFFNPQGPSRNLWDVLKWMMTRSPQPWPDHVPNGPTAKPLTRLPVDQTRITFVNHATLLIQWEGLNILTDPIWSERCSPFSWLGPKRVHAPGIHFDDLPPIDLILISHNHYDHMDLPTLKKLQEKFHPRIISGLGNGNYLERQTIPGVIELDWWQNHLLDAGQTITYVPAHHFSARWPWNRDKMLWGGFTLKGKSLLYFAGDTALGPHFQMIREKLGPPDLVFLPIGAYEPRWFMSAAHLSPDEAVQAFKVLGAKQAMGIHFGTFQLADEAIDDPPKALIKALEEQQVDKNLFWIPFPGREYPL